MILENLKNKIVVSCQASENEYLHGAEIMEKMARSVVDEGACGIRCEGVADITAIQKIKDITVIGIIKNTSSSTDVIITADEESFDKIKDLNCDIIAMDCTNRVNTDGIKVYDFFKEKRKVYNGLIMADISTVEEAIMAEKLGADLISTTLAGYTKYTNKGVGPDLELVKSVSKAVSIPVIAEGRFFLEEHIKEAFVAGAHAIVIGGAITRPGEITRRYIDYLETII